MFKKTSALSDFYIVMKTYAQLMLFTYQNLKKNLPDVNKSFTKCAWGGLFDEEGNIGLAERNILRKKISLIHFLNVIYGFLKAHFFSRRLTPLRIQCNTDNPRYWIMLRRIL